MLDMQMEVHGLYGLLLTFTDACENVLAKHLPESWGNPYRCQISSSVQFRTIYLYTSIVCTFLNLVKEVFLDCECKSPTGTFLIVKVCCWCIYRAPENASLGKVKPLLDAVTFDALRLDSDLAFLIEVL
jgi:hypothetical protein